MVKHDELWEHRFEELKDYRKKYGNCLVPKNYQYNKQLANWVKTQRVQYRKFQKGEKSSMTKERISKLKSIYFVWEPPIGRKILVKTATVAEANEKQTQVTTTGQGRKRKANAGNSLQLANQLKRQKQGPEPSSSSSQESSLNKKKKEKKGRKERPSSTETRTAIPDAVPSTSTPSITSQRREALELENRKLKKKLVKSKTALIAVKADRNKMEAELRKELADVKADRDKLDAELKTELAKVKADRDRLQRQLNERKLVVVEAYL